MRWSEQRNRCTWHLFRNIRLSPYHKSSEGHLNTHCILLVLTFGAFEISQKWIHASNLKIWVQSCISHKNKRPKVNMFFFSRCLLLLFVLWIGSKLKFSTYIEYENIKIICWILFRKNTQFLWTFVIYISFIDNVLTQDHEDDGES